MSDDIFGYPRMESSVKEGNSHLLNFAGAYTMGCQLEDELQKATERIKGLESLLLSSTREETARHEQLSTLVRRLFNLLDIEEESDSGRTFRPNYISSCRVQDTAEMEVLIERMKALIQYET